MTIFNCLFSLLFILMSFTGLAQNYPTDYFRSPLEIPLFLSGNFGELRSNHFHAGIDIKTQGVEGKKVIAVADGYISRIKVSPYGYGKALYITHPNGYTSVYGHLKKYSDRIEKVVQDYQYQKEQFSVQLFPPPFQIPVKKGELVAYSGNTGGSGGPHLHFEIRETKSEQPINPLFFGIEVRDNLKPDIYAITIFPLNDTSLINGVNQKKRFKARGTNGNYQLIDQSAIFLNGLYGLGIETVDRMNGTGNTYGLHNIQLWKEKEKIFEQEINQFAFHEGRYLNSLIDYETYIKYRRRVQKSFIDKGNKLRFYQNVKNEGKFLINDGKTHSFRYVVSDLNSNTSTLSFDLTSKSLNPISPYSISSGQKVQFFPFHQRNTFIEENILVDLPKGVLYEDLYFEFRKEAAHANTLSPLYWIHNHFTPLHSYITISIKLKNLSDDLKSKALITSTTNGKSWYAEGGHWKGDNLSVKTRSFGGYAIRVDTVSPVIRPINIYQNANMSNKWSINVKVTDDLSGINYFRGTVDGKWILMEYDAKKNSLTYFFDEKVAKGKHHFKLVVKDGVNNERQYEADFIR